ncbi:hypothetical protein [Aestuariivirga sp.]|uniref:hypothetical protein n=1 Tax=Aestuariivirga sp. TaxID=2650926 RepID=UPI0025B839F4|nr:hypothetical protein [Aestuariivirga sp.]MCA3555864.1 hypothetical protein [Aestuariivirga sp.]
MIFVRLRRDGACGQFCPEWILAQGVITPDTPERLRKMLHQMGGAKLPIVFDSVGGDIDAAMEIGRMARQHRLTTVLARSSAENCNPRNDACRRMTANSALRGTHLLHRPNCGAACLLAFAGGVTRYGSWAGDLVMPSPVCSQRARAAERRNS